MNDIIKSKELAYQFNFNAAVEVGNIPSVKNDTQAPSDNSTQETKIAYPFSGIAYAGAIAKKFGMNYAFDLSTLSCPENVPLLVDHESDDIIGMVTKFEITDKLKVEGFIFSNTESGMNVINISNAAKSIGQSFPWQMSIHIQPERVTYLDEMSEMSLNGTVIKGECYVYHDSTIREISFTTVAADNKTSVSLFSNKQKQNIIGSDMDKDKEIASLKSELEKTEQQFTAKIATLEQELNTYKKTILKNTFSAIGKEISEEKMQVFLKFPIEEFNAILSEFTALLPPQGATVTSQSTTDTPTNTAHPWLFTQVVNKPKEEGNNQEVNPLLKHAMQFSKKEGA